MFYAKNLFKIIPLPFFLLCIPLYADYLTHEDFLQIKNKLQGVEISSEQAAEISQLLVPTFGKRTLRDVEGDKSRQRETVKRARLEPPRIVVEEEEDKENTPSSTNILIDEPRERSSATSSLFVSPVKPKAVGGKGREIRLDAVYAWIAFKGEDMSYIPRHSERIDFATLLGREKITRSNLNRALAEIDRRLREWLQKYPALYHRTIYVGLSQNIGTRAIQHRTGLKEIDELEIPQTERRTYISSKKVNFYDQVYRQGFDVYMCSFVYNIPERFREIVEVLVGAQLGVLHKGNTLLGNEKAWQRVAAYVASEPRKAIISANSVVEDFHDETVKCLLKPEITAY